MNVYGLGICSMKAILLLALSSPVGLFHQLNINAGVSWWKILNPH